MAGKGGYQAPEHPAPVSLPGAGSSRTDGGPSSKQPIRSLPDAAYGANRDFVAAQQGAPLPQQTTQPAPSTSAIASQLTEKQAKQQVMQAPANSFGGPSTQPGTPVTAGAARGPGPGPEALYGTGTQASGAVTSILQSLSPFDMTGQVQALLAEAQQRGL